MGAEGVRPILAISQESWCAAATLLIGVARADVSKKEGLPWGDKPSSKIRLAPSSKERLTKPL